jgi:hypothetical protein
MTLNLSKTLLTLSATILLVAVSATSSDARPHYKRLSPTQSESVYQDSSCFASLPEIYACSASGG